MVNEDERIDDLVRGGEGVLNFVHHSIRPLGSPQARFDILPIETT